MSAASWILNPANPASPTHPDNTGAATISGDPGIAVALMLIVAMGFLAAETWVEEGYP